MFSFSLHSKVKIALQTTAPEPVRLAAQDLISDIQAVTGHRLELMLDASPKTQDAFLLRICPNAFPVEAFECYHLFSEPGNRLCIDACDLRGLLYGIYAFSEKFLHFDPLHHWTQLPPRPLEITRWPDIDVSAPPPALRFRGIFINDEDLLTGWEPGEPRHIDYPYYHTVLSRNVACKLAETALRLGYNLVIPASFLDIRNPSEEMLLEEFSRRGLILSMHHVEPVGVSAFAFDLYWSARGQKKEFSYFSEPEALREIWRDSIRRWSKYPKVIWQLGLRGRGDRPFWETGKAPEDAAGRAAIISSAIQEQLTLVKELSGDNSPICSTTLWGEGVALHRQGLLHLPREVIQVFADNCAGWRLQEDFFTAPNRAEEHYGIYCHHAVIIGTHLAQAIGARDFHTVLDQAMRVRKIDYAIFNVSNVREFIYGLRATAQITLLGPERFSPDNYLREWVVQHFSRCHAEIEAYYRKYFETFVKNERGVALFTDGLILMRCCQALWLLRDKAKQPDQGDYATHFLKLDPTHLATLGDMFPAFSSLENLLAGLKAQEERMRIIYQHTKQLQLSLPEEERPFLYAQLTYPAGLNAQFCKCETECHLALHAFCELHTDEVIASKTSVEEHLKAALEALQTYEKEVCPPYLTGDFQHWLDGSQKVDTNLVKYNLETLLKRPDIMNTQLLS